VNAHLLLRIMKIYNKLSISTFFIYMHKDNYIMLVDIILEWESKVAFGLKTGFVFCVYNINYKI